MPTQRLGIDRNTGLPRDPYQPNAVVPMKPQIAGPLTSNPAAFRAWLRRKVTEDLIKMDEATRALAIALDGNGNRREAADQARKILKASQNTWLNLQMRKPTRERPKLIEHPAPRSIAAARTDTAEMRQMLDDLTRLLIKAERSREVDAMERTRTLDLLEALQLTANQVQADARAGK